MKSEAPKRSFAPNYALPHLTYHLSQIEKSIAYQVALPNLMKSCKLPEAPCLSTHYNHHI
jgi:hypothetical protein